MKRDLFTPEHELFREQFRRFVDKEIAPKVAQWNERVRAGGAGAPGYGHMKARLIEGVDAVFGPARARRKALLDAPREVERVLAEGKQRARAKARATLDKCYQACGLR